MQASVEAKFCGPMMYHVEAFIGEPTNHWKKRILIQGYAPEKIVDAKWSKEKDGASMGGKINEYGDDVWLHIDTEGLNGAKLKVSVYNDGFGDTFVDTYIGTCYSGKINIHFKDTRKWRKYTGYTSNSEEFYIKVQKVGKKYFLNDGSSEDEHAKHIVFKDNFSSKKIEKYEDAKPLQIDEYEIDLERYEPCRFTKIAVKDEGDEIPLFEEGKLKLDLDEKKEFAVSEKIFFDFNKWNILPQSKEVLNGIATYLLESPYVPVTLGAHCDARGSHKINDPLSHHRAKASVDYLVSQGISSTRITSMGYGKRKPFIPGEDLTEEQHRQNRRVTIQYNIFGGTPKVLFIMP